MWYLRGTVLSLFVFSVSPPLDRIEARIFPFNKGMKGEHVICKLIFSPRAKVERLEYVISLILGSLIKISFNYLLNLYSHWFLRYINLYIFSLQSCFCGAVPLFFFFKLRCHSQRAAFFERFLTTMAGCFTLVLQEGPFWLYCDFQSDFWSHFESQFWSQVVFNFGDYFACKC